MYLVDNEIEQSEEEQVFTSENLFMYISSEELWNFIKKKVLSLKITHSKNIKIQKLASLVERELNHIQYSYNLTKGGVCDSSSY